MPIPKNQPIKGPQPIQSMSNNIVAKPKTTPMSQLHNQQPNIVRISTLRAVRELQNNSTNSTSSNTINNYMKKRPWIITIIAKELKEVQNITKFMQAK